MICCCFFVFMQKTAYEMRISDWSSDVCSSDLMLLANDIADKIAKISDWPAWQTVKADPVRATALLSMGFPMGAAGLSGCQKSLKLIEQNRWGEAAANMMLTQWAKQTSERAARVPKMNARGDDPT